MGIGDGLTGFMGARFARILDEAGMPITVVRPAPGQFTGYLDRPLPAPDQAPRLHEYDLVLKHNEPLGAPLKPGELIRDNQGAYYLVRTLRPSPPIVVGQVWRCNAEATVFRAVKTADTVTGVTSASLVSVATGVRCRISSHPSTQARNQEGNLLQGEARWMTEEEYSIVAEFGVLQVGDEVEAPGWPRLKVGRPAAGDTEDPSWEIPASLVLPRGTPGREV